MMASAMQGLVEEGLRERCLLSLIPPGKGITFSTMESGQWVQLHMHLCGRDNRTYITNETTDRKGRHSLVISSFI